MTRYIAVHRRAIEEIVADRLLQSADFENGKRLAEFLSGSDTKLSTIAPRLCAGPTPNGVVVLAKVNSEGSGQYVVFDKQQSGLFGTDQRPEDRVLYFQRVLRFAAKYWNQRIMSPSEIIISEAKRAIVFPHPISQKTGVRITIDLEPDGERLAKRGKVGQYLLAYRAGTDDNETAAGLTVFRKFLDELRDAEAAAQASLAEQSASNGIGTFQGFSAQLPSGRLDLHQGYDLWWRAITEDQRRFIEAPLISPVRIEGPAGSGKTLALAMKAMHLMKTSQSEGADNRTLFVTHSEASRRAITSVIQSMGGDEFLAAEKPQQLEIATLQGLCASILRQDLSDTELLDPDAYDAKQLQFLYVEQAFNAAMKEWSTYEKFASEAFKDLIQNDDQTHIIQMLQHEIAVVIKGRAAEDFDAYKALPKMKYALPTHNEGDRSFVWRVFMLYRDELVSGGQFDTDDVMLSAIGQLATPIWRRRRAREGYDYILIDETHLFNMNELSVFHHLTKREDVVSIAFAIDRSQSVGDRGWDATTDMETLVPALDQRAAAKKIKVQSVFRSSPEIVGLAFSVTSAGASLFTNFEDPLALANSSLSFEEERMCAAPIYREYVNDDSMIEAAFERADAMIGEMGSTRGNLAIVAFSDELFQRLIDKANKENKPCEILKERGSIEVVRSAQKSARYVLSMPDYVGGLEFDAVVLLGVDDGRVPPSDARLAQTKAFLNYSAHNRLYVAITRARYRVEILGVRDRGPSPILSTALASGALTRVS